MFAGYGSGLLGRHLTENPPARPRVRALDVNPKGIAEDADKSGDIRNPTYPLSCRESILCFICRSASVEII
jgi:hypothetical protein